MARSNRTRKSELAKVRVSIETLDSTNRRTLGESQNRLFTTLPVNTTINIVIIENALQKVPRLTDWDIVHRA